MGIELGVGLSLLVVLSIGLTLGIVLGHFWVKVSLGGKHREQISNLESQITSLKIEKVGSEEKLKWFTEADKSLKDSFQSLSMEALEKNNQRFIHTAQQELEKELAKRLSPVQEAFKKFDITFQAAEKKWASDYGGLNQQIKQLLESENQLRRETHQLSSSLKSSQVRGRWGELQLKRVVELSGMLAHCDFEEQSSMDSEQGRLRPDLVVNLPGNRRIVIDAKAPLGGFIEATGVKGEVHQQQLKAHAERLRSHIRDLSKKAYWKEFGPGPDFVLLFLPAEPFLNLALEADGSLMDWAVQQQVILATPCTLISLLKAVALGWQEQGVAEEAKKIREIVTKLCERVQKMGDYFGNVGKLLNKAVESYNCGVNSFESRVMPSTRQLRGLIHPGVEQEIGLLDPIETKARDWSVEAR